MKIYKILTARSLAFFTAAIALVLAFGVQLIRVTPASGSIKKIPIYCVETSEKKIAITFDAAWGAEDTAELIEILNRYNAKCTFFAVGDWLDKNPNEAKALFEAGHEIANHSDTHPAFSALSREEIAEEIKNCNEKIKNIIGQENKLVRAPSGDYNNKSIEVAEEMGMKMIQWSVDSLDWKKLSVEDMVSRILTKTENGSILLFHNGVENTPKALETVLKKLTDKGYTFVTVSELILWDNYEIDRSGKQIKN